MRAPLHWEGDRLDRRALSGSRVRPPVQQVLPAPGDPLYVRTAQRLRQLIGHGSLRPGDQIPTESELVQQFGVSRITLRKAVSLLIDEHLVVRRRGLGTFVTSPKISFPLVGLHSTRDIERAHGLDVQVRIHEYVVRKATPRERDKLRLSSRESVVAFIRQDLVASEPICVAECVLPARFADSLTPEACATHSTYELIERWGARRIARATQRFHADTASPKVGAFLRLSPGAPLFRIDRLTFDSGGEPVEWGVISYPHHEAECVVELTRESGDRRESAVRFAVQYSRTEDRVGT